MNYYYDLVLNFSEDNLFFYEWEEADKLEYFRKIPIFQVPTKTISDFINYKIRIDENFISLIKDKSKNKDTIVGNFVVFTDKNGAIALEFDDSGKEIARSFLEITEELNLLEIVYTIKLEKISYKRLEKIGHKDTLRKEEKIKLLISTEINSLVKKEDYKKLNYLYLEWFGKKSEDKNKMIKDFSKALKRKIGKDEIRLYNLIKLSYSNV